MSTNAQCFTDSTNPCAELVAVASLHGQSSDGSSDGVQVGPYDDLANILPAGQNSACKGAPLGGWYACAYGPEELTACHGYCTDYLECSTTDILIETDYVLTIFDWQNAVFLLFILLITIFGRLVFRALYQAHMAHETLRESRRNVVVPEAAASTGFDAATTDPDAAVQSGHAPRVSGSVSAKEAWDQHHHATWWSQAVDEPAVLICLAAFLFSISNICFASITEFAEGNELLVAVGFDSAYAEADAASIKARLKNVGLGLLWTVVGTLFMVVAQLSIRKILFRNLRTNLATMVMEGATEGDAATRGSNVAAGIVEAGGVIAAGLIGSASVAGPPSESVFTDLGASLLYFVLGQIVYLLFMEIFDVFFIHGTVEEALEKDLPEDQWLHLPKGQICKKGNAAMAISHASMSIAFALLVSRATYSSYELANFGVFSIVGGMLQLGLRVVVDYLIMPNAKVDDEIENHGNWGFALVVGSLQIYLSRVISSLVDDTCQDFVYNADFYCADAGESCETGFMAHRPGVRLGNETVDISRVCWDDETVCTNEATWPRGFEYGIESSCAQSSSMGLREKLTQTEMAFKFFQLNHLLQLLIALAVLWVAKHLYALPYFLCQGREDSEAERVRRLGGGEAALKRTVSDRVIQKFSLQRSIMDHKSHAVAISFSGYICGLGSIMQGLFKDVRMGYFSALYDPDCSPGKWCDSNNANGLKQIVEDLLWVLIGLGMLMITQLLSEKVVLHWASNSRAMMTSDNRALALIEAGMYAGSGFIIAAVIQAENAALSVIFFVAGELALVTYCFLYQKITKFDDREAISAKNAAAGLHWGLNVAALGLLLSRAIYLSNSVVVFGVWFAVGAPLLLAIIFLVDKIIFPHVSIEDEIHIDMNLASQSDNDHGPGGARNWGIALVAGTVAVSMAQLLNTFLRDCAFEFGVH